jgi:hypothetical protein
VLHLLHLVALASEAFETNPMVYLPAGRPDMTFSLPMAVAGIGAASMTGLTGLLLLLGGMSDATAQTGLISGSVCATSGPIALIADRGCGSGQRPRRGRGSRGPGRRAALVGNRSATHGTGRLDQHLPGPPPGGTQLADSPTLAGGAAGSGLGVHRRVNYHAQMDQSVSVLNAIKARLGNTGVRQWDRNTLKRPQRSTRAARRLRRPGGDVASRNRCGDLGAE